MSDEVEVGFNDDNFTINDRQVGLSAADMLAQFQTDYFPPGTVGADFRNLNIGINHGDSIKDGTNAATLAGLALYQENQMSLQDLKTLAHSVIDRSKAIGYTTRQFFTRDKKGDDSVKLQYAGMQFLIGFDSGLGVDNFLNGDGQYGFCYNIGKYIDQSSMHEANQHYPERNQPITITEDAFQQLGYEDCNLSATCVGTATNIIYTYNMKLGAHRIEKTDTTNRNGDANIKQFGNATKNKISSGNRDVKKAVVIGKGLGDKLQVFIMRIKSAIARLGDPIHCISTCDEIVLLFCIILRLPCFYTSIGVEGGVKINEVLHYDPDNVNPEKAAQRFEREKQIVLNGLIALIALINSAKGRPITVSGDASKIFEFTDDFYNLLIRDLTALLDDANKTTVNATMGVPEINAQIDLIKSMTVNNFIRQGRDGTFTLVRTANKYSNYSHQHNGKPELNAFVDKNLHSAAFFYIATTYFKERTPSASASAATSRYRRGGNPDELQAIIGNYFNMEEILCYYSDPDHQDSGNPMFPSDPDEIIFDANSQLYYFIVGIAMRNKHYSKLLTIFAGVSNSLIFDVYSHALNELQIRRDYSVDALFRIINIIMKEIMSVRQCELRDKLAMQQRGRKPLRQPHPHPNGPLSATLKSSRSRREERRGRSASLSRGRSASPSRKSAMPKILNIRSQSAVRQMSSSRSRSRGGSNKKTRKNRHKRKHTSSSRKADRGTM